MPGSYRESFGDYAGSDHRLPESCYCSVARLLSHGPRREPYPLEHDCTCSRYNILPHVSGAKFRSSASAVVLARKEMEHLPERETVMRNPCGIAYTMLLSVKSVEQNRHGTLRPCGLFSTHKGDSRCAGAHREFHSFFVLIRSRHRNRSGRQGG